MCYQKTSRRIGSQHIIRNILDRYSVDIDSIEALAEKGVIIIVIEKEGIADVLVNFAEEYGIALVHTQGKFVEYVKGLIEAAKKSGSVVVTLTDYDADGMDMAKRTRTETPRIGVTRETVTWLQQNGYPVTEADVQEEYSPTTDTDDEYLKDHRIELDSIVAKVGAEAFWKYIMYQLQQPQFSPEGFDYNRVDVMPANELLYLENISNFLSYLNKFFDELLEEERGKIEEDQMHIKNLVTLEDKIAENQKRLDPIVAKDKNVKLIVSKIIKLLKLLPDSEDFISN